VSGSLRRHRGLLVSAKVIGHRADQLRTARRSCARTAAPAFRPARLSAAPDPRSIDLVPDSPRATGPASPCGPSVTNPPFAAMMAGKPAAECVGSVAVTLPLPHVHIKRRTKRKFLAAATATTIPRVTAAAATPQVSKSQGQPALEAKYGATFTKIAAHRYLIRCRHGGELVTHRRADAVRIVRLEIVCSRCRNMRSCCASPHVSASRSFSPISSSTTRMNERYRPADGCCDPATHDPMWRSSRALRVW
jgi:hypothetical protein